MTRCPSTRARMAPDFDSRSRYLPPYAFAKAGPCFVQWTRSREVATVRRGIRRVPLGVGGKKDLFPSPTVRGVPPPPRPPYLRRAAFSRVSNGAPPRGEGRPPPPPP